MLYKMDLCALMCMASFFNNCYQFRRERVRLPAKDTLGLWHFDGAEVTDISENGVKADVEGKAAWNANQAWNKEDKAGESFVFDDNTVISLGEADALIPKMAITIEAWVYPANLSGWRLIFTNWDGPPGAYHLGVENGIAKFHINTEKGSLSPVRQNRSNWRSGNTLPAPTIPAKSNSTSMAKRWTQQTTAANWLAQGMT